MVGQDPALQRSTTITVDVTPLNVTVGGRTFNGTDTLQPTLNSPVFTNDDYTSTQFVSDPTVANGHTTGGIRPEWHERPVHLHGRPQPIPRLPRPPAGLPGLSSPLCLRGLLA